MHFAIQPFNRNGQRAISAGLAERIFSRRCASAIGEQGLFGRSLNNSLTGYAGRLNHKQWLLEDEKAAIAAVSARPFQHFLTFFGG